MDGPDVKPRRTGMRGLRPLDSDPVAQIHPNHDLILRVEYGSGGWGLQGHGRRRKGHRSSSPRRRLAGVSRSRPSGPYFGRDQARENACDTRNPPEQLAQVPGGRNSSRHGKGGSGRQSSPARARSRAYGGLRSTIASAKGPGGSCDAHQGAEQAGTRRRDDLDGGPAVETFWVRGRGGCRGSPSS
jgi:hypothetical protein